MPSLKEEIAAFVEERRRVVESARQIAALHLACGIDLQAALAESGAARLRTVRRLRRVMERERLKGIAGRPGYDLERHIALKQSLDRLGPAGVSPTPKADGA